jgi:hypothetical protein
MLIVKSQLRDSIAFFSASWKTATESSVQGSTKSSDEHLQDLGWDLESLNFNKLDFSANSENGLVIPSSYCPQASG